MWNNAFKKSRGENWKYGKEKNEQLRSKVSLNSIHLHELMYLKAKKKEKNVFLDYRNDLTEHSERWFTFGNSRVRAIGDGGAY